MATRLPARITFWAAWREVTHVFHNFPLTCCDRSASSQVGCCSFAFKVPGRPCQQLRSFARTLGSAMSEPEAARFINVSWRH
ncbi:hypothetical protein RRG08_027852 [Elysia crispata]|uniref:Uncharacterized protein n=1 Tax=Elysia crispata TaxID=231223 RepID=A0AAE0YT90_9GAST|nr:hypothetical protein RRG08_027852 [Elysia crispata]